MVTAQRLARSIVRDSLRPKEYESVIVSTYPHTIELAEEIVLECQRLGADPFMVLDTDRTFYGQFKNFSEENLRTCSSHCLGLAEYVRSYVYLGGPRDPGPMARIGNEKFGAMYAGEQAHYDKNLVKKPKNVFAALGQVTRERARTYGFGFPTWKAMVEAAIAVEYEKMGRDGKLVAERLSHASDVHVTADNGTDLRFRLAGADRAPEIDDGIISDEDIAAGNPDVALPAGNVFVAPIEASAQGTFVSDVGIPQQGRLIEGLRWTFRDGHLTDAAARKNLSASQAGWSTATGDKDMFAMFSLGMNPRAKSGYLQNAVVSGAVSIGIGENRVIGGKNTSSYGFASSLAHGTVDVDGQVIVRDGKLVV